MFASLRSTLNTPVSRAKRSVAASAAVFTDRRKATGTALFLVGLLADHMSFQTECYLPWSSQTLNNNPLPATMATTILTSAASANPGPVEQELLDMVEVLTVFGKVRATVLACAPPP